MLPWRSGARSLSGVGTVVSLLLRLTVWEVRARAAPMGGGSGCISTWGGGVLASQGDCLSVVYTVCLLHLHVRPLYLCWLVTVCLPARPKLYICSMYLNTHWIIPGDTALCHIDSRARCFATDNPEPEPEPEPNFGHRLKTFFPLAILSKRDLHFDNGPHTCCNETQCAIRSRRTRGPQPKRLSRLPVANHAIKVDIWAVR